MNQTYIHKNDQQLGPFEDSLILTSLLKGSFDYSDLCWREGWENWKPLAELYPRPNNPSPVSQSVSKTMEEKTEWEGRPSLIHFWVSISLTVFFALAAIVVLFLPSSAANHEAAFQEKYIFSIALIVLFFVSALTLIGNYLSRKYIVTTQRVILEVGVIVKSSNQLRIKDIRSINVSKHGIGGLLLGMGSVELSTAATDDAEIVFSGIRNADKIRDLVSGLQ